MSLGHFLVWLDANEANAAIVPSTTSFTLPPSMFSDGAGGYVSGPHTVHVRAVDDGGAMSVPASFTWNVTAPVGEVLLIDDDPAAQSAAVDPMYTNAFDNQLGAGNYTRVNLETANPFRSPADLEYSFAFFRSVFWYQENNTARSAPRRWPSRRSVPTWRPGGTSTSTARRWSGPTGRSRPRPSSRVTRGRLPAIQPAEPVDELRHRQRADPPAGRGHPV
jgi:hypothetical protein